MGILIDFIRDFRLWDKPSKWAFSIAIGLLIVVFGVLVLGDGSIRTPSLIGFMGLVIGLQLIAMWGNRHMVTPYTQAQRAFLAGDFLQARDILEQVIADNIHEKISADVYILLGNTYRNLGDVEHSLRLLRRAVDANSDYAFALYGLGRTQMVMGDYQEALTTIKKSLLSGAPSVVKFDLGYIQYALGLTEEATGLFQEILRELQEPYRQLMAHFLLYTSGVLDAPSGALIQAGLPYWEDEARRFAHTRYGQDIGSHLSKLQTML